MAGGVLKTFGVLFLIAGVLLLIAGIAAAGYGMMDQQDHEEDAGPLGVGEDTERSDTNEALVVGGAAAAGIGLFGIALGVIFLLAGGARERRALRMQQQQVVVQTVDGPTYTSAGRGADVAPQATTRFAPPKYTSAHSNDTAAGAAEGDALADRAGDAPSERPLDAGQAGTTASGTDPRRKVLVAVALVAAVLLVGVVTVALVGGPTGPGGNPLLGDRPPALIRDESFSGTTGAGFSVLGNDPNGMMHEREFVLPGATQRLEMRLNWTPVLGGPATYDVDVAVDVDGQWVSLGSERLSPGDVYKSGGGDVDGLGGRDVRLQVRPAGDNTYASQSFDGTWSFYRR